MPEPKITVETSSPQHPMMVVMAHDAPNVTLLSRPSEQAREVVAQVAARVLRER